MATITRYPFMRHLRSTPTMYVSHVVNGKPRHQGVGVAFWFRPMTSAISEVPTDDREQDLLITFRTRDLQPVNVPGTITYRFHDPVLTASRVDFSVDLADGTWPERPLERVGAMIHGATAAAVIGQLSNLDLVQALSADSAALRSRVLAVLAADERLTSVGVAVVGVRFSTFRPDPDVEKALQTPAREGIQQEADKATFERRALAVEREAAIGENELANQIELSRRREQLIVQKGANTRREAEDAATADGITVRAEASRATALGQARADAERAIGEATADTERARIAAYNDVPRDVLVAIALREAAAHLPNVEHLVITPDLLNGLLAKLTSPAQGA